MDIGQKQISKKEKREIIEESKKAGCVITELAKKYGIRARKIYDWRNKEKINKKIESSKKIENPEDNFIELSLAMNNRENVDIKKSGILKKAVLELNKVTIKIDGEIKSSALVKMLNVLEEL